MLHSDGENDEPGDLRNERGCTFFTGAAFYRPESSQARDLAVLAAIVHRKRTKEPLRVLDCCSASGSRGARYIQQAGASFVWCNDYDPSNKELLLRNLMHGARGGPGEECGDASPMCTERVQLSGLRGEVMEGQVPRRAADGGVCDEEQRWRVSQFEAVRLLTQCWLTEDYYDLVDVDSFGSAGRFTSAALGAVKNGGLLYLTCTDGLASSGRTPWTALCEYGTFTAPVPFANEQGLRMLIGAAVMEGARRGQAVRPVFSLFSPHGPVFRVMVQVEQSGQRQGLRSIQFLAHDQRKGDTRAIGFEEIGNIALPMGTPADEAAVDEPVAICGPLWTGPLHCPEMLRAMQVEAVERGWEGLGVADGGAARGRGSPKYKQWDLDELLDVMLEEADPSLRPGHINVADVSRVGRLSGTPSCAKLILALRAEGHSASRCHITTRGLYTSASMGEVVSVANRVLGLVPRPAPPPEPSNSGAGSGIASVLGPVGQSLARIFRW